MLNSIKNKVDAHLRRRVREEVDLERVVVNHLSEDLQKVIIDFTLQVRELTLRIERLENQIRQKQSESIQEIE